jgi:hypothetical protein
MSAELFDGESVGAHALPAVDILPVKPARKPKGSADEEMQAPPLLEASPEGWALPAQPVVNPWTGAPTDAAAPQVPAYAPPAPVRQVPVQQVPVQQVPVQQMPAPQGAPLSVVPMPDQPGAYDAGDAEAPSPKKFLGMQVRRQKKAPAEAPVEAAAPFAPDAFAPDAFAPVQPQVQPHVQAPPQFQAPPMVPVAAWPTDVAVPVVAGAEPYAQVPMPSGPPAEAREAAPAVQAAVAPPLPDAAPVEVTSVEVAAVEVAQPSPSMAPVAAPVPTPVPEALVAPPVDSAELASLRAQLGVSESQRLAAENRADQAVAYAQQTQARLQQLEAEGQARIQAAETKARSAANEAQDWQIRHREAEGTIAELAASVASTEQRMSDLRAERDELSAALEEATAPEHHVPTI